jgi:uncharacterized MnhB-related membrane protein
MNASPALAVVTPYTASPGVMDVLAVLFLAFQAPDVTLSELTVGSVALPILLLLALAKVRGREK